MRIGIDLTPIQGPHRMRGIGSVIVNVVNRLETVSGEQHDYVFFVHEGDRGEQDPRDLLDIGALPHEFRNVVAAAEPARWRRLYRFVSLVRHYRHGDDRIYDTSDLDVFIQMDQGTALPKTRARTVLFAYDLIPHLLETRYLRSFPTSRRLGLSVMGSLRNQLDRWGYYLEILLNVRRADLLVAISANTKKDFADVLNVDERKISVVHLGAPDPVETPDEMMVHPYRDTGWGPCRDLPMTLEAGGFILYVGGIDPRRQLIELLATINNLRARGESVRLVLAGDILSSVDQIPEPWIREYFRGHSYVDDVLLLGYVTDVEKAWLYRHALAVVYPSLYEGFGLPVLEAMQAGTPVITYPNSSLREVGGDAALYVSTSEEIIQHLLRLRSDPAWADEVRARSIQRAAQFSWTQTTAEIVAAATAGLPDTAGERSR